MAGKANLEELRGIRLKRIVYLQGKVHRHKVAIRIHIFLSCASITLGLAGLTTTLTIYGWILIDKGLLLKNSDEGAEQVLLLFISFCKLTISNLPSSNKCLLSLIKLTAFSKTINW